MADRTNDRANDLVAELNRLRAIVTSANSEAERAQGALSEVLGRLKKQFGCASVKEGKKKLRELERDSERAAEAFSAALAAFKEEHQL